MKKCLTPYDVIFTLYGKVRHKVVLAYSRCHAVQVLIRYYEDEVVRSPDCLDNFIVEEIPHIR